MSRYAWPAAARARRTSDDPARSRRPHAARARGLRRRRRTRRRAHRDRHDRASARGLRGRRPAAAHHLWQPLGPDTVIAGQAIGAPRIAGRVNMLAVHPDGKRVYAASANGGVWYSTDGGVHWRSLGGLGRRRTASATSTRPAQRNACGAIAVRVGRHRGQRRWSTSAPARPRTPATRSPAIRSAASASCVARPSGHRRRPGPVDARGDESARRRASAASPCSPAARTSSPPPPSACSSARRRRRRHRLDDAWPARRSAR